MIRCEGLAGKTTATAGKEMLGRCAAVCQLCGLVLSLGLALLLGGAASEAIAASPVPHQKPSATTQTHGGTTTGSGSLSLTRPASDYFSQVKTPSDDKANPIGSYAKGCIAGAKALPLNGPGYQVIRPSRNRFWGHPELISYLENLGRKAPSVGWRGLVVADMGQPRGGPLPAGHASHQIGLDADIWLQPMPDHVMSASERENIKSYSMVKSGLERAGADRSVNPKTWNDNAARFIRLAAKDPRVERIFVSPGIKQALCKFEKEDRGWLRHVRPYWGHDSHIHIRLRCPAGASACQNQPEPPAGDGCGKELKYWMSDVPWVPKPLKPGEKRKVVKRAPLTLAGMPKACQAVLQEP